MSFDMLGLTSKRNGSVNRVIASRACLRLALAGRRPMIERFDPPPIVDPACARVDHASAPLGAWNDGGMTLTTLVGTPSSRTIRPMTPESPPNRRFQSA